MNKLIVSISLLFLITYLTAFCQDNTIVIDKISHQICKDLDSISNIDKLTVNEANLIIGHAILSYKTEWDNELDKIENSRKAGQTIFDYLLNHRLQQNCAKFKLIDNKLDKYLIDNIEYRELYLTIKDFILSAESDITLKELTKFFDPRLDNSFTLAKLDSLKTELNAHKRLSGLYIMKKDDHLYFYVNVFDYKRGNENVAVMILFNDLTDKLIDEWDFKNKQEIEAERKKQEEEFENTPLPPPTPR